MVTEHAERWAILDAARRGKKLDGCIMVAAWASCHDCARAIIWSGIRVLIRHSIIQHDSPNWRESCTVGDAMLREAGVEIIDFTERLGCSVLFNGKIVNLNRARPPTITWRVTS